MNRAGFGIRLGAAAIDAVAMYVLNMAATFIVVPLAMAGAATTRQFTRVLGLTLAVTAALWLGYASTELVGRASPAKRLLKLRIAAADGGEATLGQRARRWGLKFLPVLLYLAAGAVMYAMIFRSSYGPNAWFLVPQIAVLGSVLVVFGGFFATLGRERRALHDYLGGTVVLRPGEGPQGFAPIMAQPVLVADSAADTVAEAERSA